MNAEQYQQFTHFLHANAGIDLGSGKEYLISSRLRKIMKEQQLQHFGQLLDQINCDMNHALKKNVIDAMTTNETMWFRDEHPFYILQNKILPQWKAKHSAPLNIWSAACSTGQEPYSIAMCLEQYRQSNQLLAPLFNDILATDLSHSAIKIAKTAKYSQLAINRGLKQPQLERFFRKHEDYWQVTPKICQRVMFRQMNLKQNFFGLGPFDIIFCRNVLIYFNSEFKIEILLKLHQCLKAGGYLFIGASEAINELDDKFEMIHCQPGIVYRKR